MGRVLNTLPKYLQLLGDFPRFLDCWLIHPSLDHHGDPIQALFGRQTARIPISLKQLLSQQGFASFGLFDGLLDSVQQIDVLLLLFLPILEVSFLGYVSLLGQFGIAAQ